jgi:hypothetical protein
MLKLPGGAIEIDIRGSGDKDENLSGSIVPWPVENLFIQALMFVLITTLLPLPTTIRRGGHRYRPAY